MAAEKTRIVKIHKGVKYDDRFIQMDWVNAGKAMSILTKASTKNLFLYFLGNTNDYEFQLLPAKYAGWMQGKYSENGIVLNESERSKWRKQISTGIEEMVDKGYMVEKIKGVYYDFYEYGVPTEQSIPDRKDCNEEGKIVPNVTKFPEKEKLSDSGKVVTEEKDCSEQKKVSQEGNSCPFVF